MKEREREREGRRSKVRLHGLQLQYRSYLQDHNESGLKQKQNENKKENKRIKRKGR